MSSALNIKPLSEWGDGFTVTSPLIIAGPCSAETEEQTLATARELKAIGVNIFRAGIWKPRTHPDSFEGIGTAGLPWLQRIQRELGMMVAVEVAGARHVEQALAAGVDILWIGARTTANPFMVQEVADALQGVDIPVLVKNPVNPDIELWKGAFERLHHAGLTRLALVLRGCTPFTHIRYRNDPQWQMFVDMHQYCPTLPSLCDPSHMAGAREYVAEISQKALDLGFDGLIVESHNNPACALSDSAQQLTPTQLRSVLDGLHLRHGGTRNDAKLVELRTLIDTLDTSLIGILAQRMEVARDIGHYKREHNLAILQQTRWDKIVEKINTLANEKGLDSHFVEELFKLIHQSSIECQVEIMERHEQPR